VKIEIDTTKDSKEEIQKAIKLLMSLLGETSVLTNSPNIFESSTPSLSTQTPSANAFSLFDTPTTQPTQQSIIKQIKKTAVQYY